MWRIKWYGMMYIGYLYKLLHHQHFSLDSIFYGLPRVVRIDRISCGKRLKCNPDVYLNGDGGIQIGNDVTLSKGVSIIASTYNIDAFFSGKRIHDSHGIMIGNNVWIGAGATILDGVKICDNVIIGAGAIVTKDIVDEFSIYAGVPARCVRKYNLVSKG